MATMVDTYGDRLAAAMGDARISTAELARQMGLSYQAVRKVLLGGKFGTESNVAAARILHVSSDWLATGKKKERPWLSAETQIKVLRLDDEELVRLENIVRAFLRPPSVGFCGFALN